MKARTATLRGSALVLQDATDSEILLHGPARTGKSFAALLKADTICRKWPNARVLFIRKTRRSMSETILQTFEDHILTLHDDRKKLLGKGNRATRDNYIYENESRIVLAGLNNADDWANVMSSEYDLIILFEALQLRQHDYESLITRLSNFVVEDCQQLIADTNPGRKRHHLRKRQQSGRMRELRSFHRDNPKLHTGRKWTRAGAAYMEKLRSLTGNRRIRLLDGDWCNDENVVFRSFVEDEHVGKPKTDADEYILYRVFSFSQVRPSVCQWWLWNPETSDLWLYREIYRSGLTMGKFIKSIKEHSDGEEYAATITSPETYDASSRRGIECMPAEDDFLASVAAVEDRLYWHDLCFSPEALIEVDSDLDSASLPTRTIEEFEAYTYPLNVEGKPINERPVDLHCAAMDCLRWICEHLENGSCGVARDDDTPDEAVNANGWEMLASAGRANRVNTGNPRLTGAL